LGSFLRLRLRRIMAALVCAFVVTVIITGFQLDTAFAPFRSGAVHTSGIVTSQEVYQHKGRDTCNLGIAFTLNGQQLHSTVDSGNECSTSLLPGEQVQLTLSPNNPLDIAVLGHGYPREDQWQGVVFMGIIVGGGLGIRLLMSVSSYRRTRRLFADGTQRHEVTATVQARTKLKDRRIFSLNALDTTGRSQTFTMTLRDEEAWRPVPQTGDTLTFALLSDGTANAVISIEGAMPSLVKLAVPNNFQLRATGL
jgi:hypothetical protein